MPLGGLQHYTIEPSDLEKTKEFYCEVLGLELSFWAPRNWPAPAARFSSLTSCATSREGRLSAITPARIGQPLYNFGWTNWRPRRCGRIAGSEPSNLPPGRGRPAIRRRR